MSNFNFQTVTLLPNQPLRGSTNLVSLELQQRLTFDHDGNVRVYNMVDGQEKWMALGPFHPKPCFIYGICGPNNYCTNDPTSGKKCSCLPEHEEDKPTCAALMVAGGGKQRHNFGFFAKTKMLRDGVDFTVVMEVEALSVVHSKTIGDGGRAPVEMEEAVPMEEEE
ncbi:hypothetical protein LR48_Vigan04g204500 [Vigna angularis]|uniref:S-locus glycoprotein domain-containing protein n=1 Tax=Phaseolus angularis TaxID=3914 RepID=A0A0L9UGZ5_PHAAN|nr:hypothetical protein LR48_Vigan04g204500 [Vigna angularis]